MSRHAFVITVTGAMDESLLRVQVQDVGLSIDRGVTRLRAVSADPPVLHGVLHRGATFGLELLDVHQVEKGSR